MTAIALVDPLPCQVWAFFCQASMQDAAPWLGVCKDEYTGDTSNSKLQRLMVRDVKACQDHGDLCMLSPADLS